MRVFTGCQQISKSHPAYVPRCHHLCSGGTDTPGGEGAEGLLDGGKPAQLSAHNSVSSPSVSIWSSASLRIVYRDVGLQNHMLMLETSNRSSEGLICD